MEITATNLSRIQDGSYYLSNTTGEIKKAGFWQWFKCFTGIGDGREKVQRLVDRIKADLLADAAVNDDASLTNALNALDTTKSISSSDLKRIASNFKAAHPEAIAKSDAMREAKAVVDEVVNDWAIKGKTTIYDRTNMEYVKKLALYAARPVADKAIEFGEDKARLVKNIKGKMELLRNAIGVAELVANDSHLDYPSTNQSPIPGRRTPYTTGFKCFVLDELHFRFLASRIFDKNGKVRLGNLFESLIRMPESELQRCRNILLDAPLDGPEKADALEKFLDATRDLEKKYNDNLLTTIEIRREKLGNVAPEANAAFDSLVDELRTEFGEKAIPAGTKVFTLLEGTGKAHLLLKDAMDAASARKRLASPEDLKEALRESARKGAVKMFIGSLAAGIARESCGGAALPHGFGGTLVKMVPGLAGALEGAKSRQEIENLVTMNAADVKSRIEWNAKIEKYTSAVIAARATEKLAKALGTTEDELKTRPLSFKKLNDALKKLTKELRGETYPGCHDKDFDMDAAFDKITDDFVNDRMKIRAEIDALEGLAGKTKSAWKGYVFEVDNPRKTAPAKIAGLVSGKITAQSLADALRSGATDKAAFDGFAEWVKNAEAEFKKAYGEEEWAEFGTDGRSPVYLFAIKAMVDEKPEIAELFNLRRELLTNPPADLTGGMEEETLIATLEIARTVPLCLGQ